MRRPDLRVDLQQWLDISCECSERSLGVTRWKASKDLSKSGTRPSTMRSMRPDVHAIKSVTNIHEYCYVLIYDDFYENL